MANSNQSIGRGPVLGTHVAELRLSLRNNAGAYGYSVMITGSFATLSATEQTPQVYEVFGFIVGAVASFALVEAVATRGFRRSLRAEEPSQVVALGSALNLFAITAAVGSAVLIGGWTPPPISWGLGSFAASVIYLIVTSVEMAVARRIERARGLG